MIPAQTRIIETEAQNSLNTYFIKENRSFEILKSLMKKK